MLADRMESGLEPTTFTTTAPDSEVLVLSELVSAAMSLGLSKLNELNLVAYSQPDDRMKLLDVCLSVPGRE